MPKERLPWLVTNLLGALWCVHVYKSAKLLEHFRVASNQGHDDHGTLKSSANESEKQTGCVSMWWTVLDTCAWNLMSGAYLVMVLDRSKPLLCKKWYASVFFSFSRGLEDAVVMAGYSSMGFHGLKLSSYPLRLQSFLLRDKRP